MLALAIVAVLGPGLGNAMIAVGISLIPSYARMVRASVLTVKHNAYIEAARVIGCGDVRLLAAHILPNVAVPILVLTTVGIAWATHKSMSAGASAPSCFPGGCAARRRFPVSHWRNVGITSTHWGPYHTVILPPRAAQPTGCLP